MNINIKLTSNALQCDVCCCSFPSMWAKEMPLCLFYPFQALCSSTIVHIQYNSTRIDVGHFFQGTWLPINLGILLGYREENSSDVELNILNEYA